MEIRSIFLILPVNGYTRIIRKSLKTLTRVPVIGKISIIKERIMKRKGEM